MEFKKEHPDIRFILQQGEYTSIARWVEEGSVDFGFANAEAVPGLETSILYKDEMAAVLPKGHPLTGKQVISLKDLEQEPFILLDEGEYSVPEQAFRRAGLHPKIEYKVYDDYSILAMVRQSLGVSAMYKRVLEGFEAGLAVRPVKERMERPVALVERLEYDALCSKKVCVLCAVKILTNYQILQILRNFCVKDTFSCISYGP